MLIDMPIEELKVYRGRNPRPADMDEYWGRAIREMEGKGVGCELIEAAFQTPKVQCYDMYFEGLKGARVHAKFLRPREVRGKAPAVLQFHGYSGDSGHWYDKVAYAAEGFFVAALDCRGQGGLSEDVGGHKGSTFHGQFIRGIDDENPDNLLMRDIFLDTAQLARIVMAMDSVDETRVGAMGGSQGGALTLACAALTPTLNRAAPVFPFLCDYQRVWEMDLAKDAYQELSDYFRRYDPRHERQEEIFTRFGYIDNQHLADRIRARIRMFTGLMDTVCPPSTQFAAYNRIRSDKDVVLYPDFCHETLPGAEDETFAFMMEMTTN